MQLATSKTRSQYPLSPKKIIKKTLVSITVWFVLCMFLYIITIGTAVGLSAAANYNVVTVILVITLVTFIIFGTIFFLTYLYQKWYFETYFYDLTDNFIIIRKGVFLPHEINIPYERVQDVYVDQDIYDRIFGIYDVHLSSATISSGMAAHIDGVEKEAADGLKTFLLETIHEKISKKKG